jgi:hypothetical protein
MGWNDRLPEDPFIPSDTYYQERDEYEAWLDYMEAKLREEDKISLTSQNIDPATLAGATQTQETPERRGFVSRLVAKFFGKEVSKIEQQESLEKDAGLPF